jgi:hypothetical protein
VLWRQRSATDDGFCLDLALDSTMIPIRALLFSRLLRSAWRVGLVALLIATLMEWGLGSLAAFDLS